MRSFLTVLLMIVFTAVHSLPAAAETAQAEQAAPVKMDVLILDMTAHEAEQLAAKTKSAHDLAQIMNCCGSDIADANTHASSKCASDCTTLLPAAPEVTLPRVLREHANAISTVKSAAPPVADHPPQTV
ncbi:hypothetical protein [Labrenzia sp. PHM005]|uniref:hypothetical protein n=1 Tax=Labrenzia sp. PHM005 TaxID=2590016 RepID=UPI00113FEFCF|nr:hypothetical protein [Labrenzia sp. PHM005]QDG78979.1 hypothetical protein FJ695_25650 [Labrenzia sp. PHM005]